MFLLFFVLKHRVGFVRPIRVADVVLTVVCLVDEALAEVSALWAKLDVLLHVAVCLGVVPVRVGATD